MAKEFRSSKEVTEGLWTFEKELNLFDVQIRGVFIWERIRYHIEKSILEKLGFIEDKFYKERRDFKKKMMFMFQSVGHLVRELPLLLAPREIVFIGKMVRKLGDGSSYWDMLFDPIVEKLEEKDYLFLQPSYNYKYFHPHKTSRLSHMGFISIFSELYHKILRKRIVLTNAEETLLREIEEKLYKEFGVNIQVYEKVKAELLTRKIELAIYGKLLKILKPKILILQVGNIYNNIIEVCKEQGILTIEMQHGAIGPYDVIYSYPEGISKRIAPDYFFVFGDYWRETIRFPLSKENVISVGNPYLDIQREKYSRIPKRDQILFLSQGTIGKELSKFAVSLAEEKDLVYKILYKLHPDEYENWRKRFPALALASDEGKIEVIDSDIPSVYKLIAESKIQVGVYSTAIYEGLAFGLQTFLLDISKIENMKHLIKMGYVEKISSPKEIVKKVQMLNELKNFDKGYFFKEDAVNNVKYQIEKIKSGRDKYYVKS